MTSSARRHGLLGSTSVAVLVLGLMGTAQADTTIEVGLPTVIDYTAISDGVAPDENILNDASTTGGVNGVSNILSFQTIQGVGTGTATTGDSDVSIISAAGDDGTYGADGNDIFTQIRGNNVSSSVGTSDATDGVVILNAQETVPTSQTVPTDGTTLAAFSGGNEVIVTLLGDGQNVTAAIEDNSISARASFNTAFATVETTVPNTLVASTGANYDATYAAPLLPDSIEQSADFNVASVQVNSGFASGQVAPEAGTANVEGATIGLIRAYGTDGAVDITGAYDVLENTATATTLGNAADNSIFLLGGEAGTFDGSAIASSTQVSRDLGTDAGLPNISATNDDSTIAAVFFNDGTTSDGPGGAFNAIGNGMTASVSDNTVGATASINSSRNELGFDSTLDLDGGSALALVTLELDDTTGLNDTSVAADFATVNVQTALGAADDSQGSYSLVEDAIVGLFVEDVDGDSTLVVDGNAVNSTASGNTGTNVIRNNGGALGDGSPLVAGTFTSANQQYLSIAEIDAEILDSTIGALVGTIDDDVDAFGGLDGSTLTVDGNSLTATANGSVATALIDLAGLSLDVARNVGAGIITDREEAGPETYSSLFTGSGVSINNLQISNQVTGVDFANVDSLVEDSQVIAHVNYDNGDVSTEIVGDSSVSVSDNDFVASSTVNGFDGLVLLSSANSLAGDVAGGSVQTIEGSDISDMDADADVDDNQAELNLGIGVSTSNLTGNVDDNGFLALLSGNDSSLAIQATAGTEITSRGILLGGNNATTNSATDAAAETLNSGITATAGFLLVSDQALSFIEFDADIDDNDVDLNVLIDVDNGTIDLANATFSASGNDMVGQALGNTASNLIALDAGTSLSGVDGNLGDALDPGAIAGIVSTQSAATATDPDDVDLDVDIDDNFVDVDILEGSTAGAITNLTVTVNDNAIQGLGFMNVVGNQIVADANTIVPADSDGVDLTTTIGGVDQTLTVADAGFFVVNRQRNEAAGPEASPVQGGGVDVRLGDDDDNGIEVTINGGSTGASNSTFETNANLLQATGAANVANNLIDTSADTTAAASAGILNRQGNSGDVDAFNFSSEIALTLTAVTLDSDPEHIDVTLNLDRNVIGSSATGSSVSNAISASAGTTLTGTNGDGLDGVFVGAGPGAGFLATIDTVTGSLDTNADSFANGNLAILNSQRNYGVDDGPSVIDSFTEDALVSLTVEDAIVINENVTLSLDQNRVRSQAVANAATNSLSVTSGTGGPATGTVLNNQAAADTDVFSEVLNSAVEANVEGTFSNGTIGVTGNTIIASADLNNATNLITASAAVGSNLGSSTIANYQSSAGSSVSTAVTGSSISTASGDVVSGALVGGSTVTASGNQIGTSGTINNAVNRIASPGQSFTRTSSF